ncbi:GAF and ANTAR domain-containing protein [Haloechinothrix sp. LS1_15]|uniref:GAF and ANTAR domain-containing protein n=1 Tax=Haloechinothrix sp. LS1_15 TaxID=2652248 RepID=UPI00294407E6|nr:GAF and ANTAR domain-containing protein [Haloechinothrix sp. LS1_15]MDV6012890.1 ANTAR domain-containing protein [Haloechinothrix sp. LS1_15]
MSRHAVAGPGDPAGSLRQLCRSACSELGMSGATIVVVGGNTAEVRYATDPVGAHLAQLQVIVGEGPVADTMRSGCAVLLAELDDLSLQSRWPLFLPLAAETVASALFTLVLPAGTSRIGVLALHRTVPGPMVAGTFATARRFASSASRLLLAEQRPYLTEDQGTTKPGFRLANPEIHQATGIIAAQLDVRMDEAFLRLRSRAFTDHRRLAGLAGDVVAHRVRFDHRAASP